MVAPRFIERRDETSASLQLRLLNTFMLEEEGQVVDLPIGVQRLVIYLTLKGRPLQRAHVAGTLWPATTDARASANLRTALWKLNQLCRPVVKPMGSSLQIDPEVRVDLNESTANAYEFLNNGGQLAELDLSQFCYDLLSDWYDDWIVFERQRFHQLRLKTLEVICDRLIEAGDFVGALEAGLAAVAAEPLRESAHRAVIKVHLAESNRAEAVMEFRSYCQMLKEELGIAPSPVMLELVRV
jgi:DNA-binding SARP family transcriptional activator